MAREDAAEWTAAPPGGKRLIGALPYEGDQEAFPRRRGQCVCLPRWWRTFGGMFVAPAIYKMDISMEDVPAAKPISVRLLGSQREHTLPGRLDICGLREPGVREKLWEVASLYFAENQGTEELADILWEALKAVLRGQAQAALGRQKKEARLACNTIVKDIICLEAAALASNKPEDSEKLRLRQSELRALAENQAKQYAIAVQRRLYDVGDKAGRLLA
ncbi:hypothetical protein NDU88_009344 [Pleurodeles waltl]|uniref:Uncharacterized protein n=1 Tax=Pleurodeles waltl TaxID=8319 RepID=A0AAV7PRV0_PLEWA|nr:hypothetical protein NDU88_009344 [Pleurodeles waltl]